MPVRRRRFLGQGLMLILAGLGRRAWTQGLAFRLRPLARPVVVLPKTWRRPGVPGSSSPTA